MTTGKIDELTGTFVGSTRIRAIGRAATLATVVGAVLGVASLIRGWNWSETFVVLPYVVFEGSVAVFGLFQGRAKAWAFWSESHGEEIFLPILGTWLFPVVVVLYGPTNDLPAFAFVAIYLWLAWSILSLRTNFSVLPEARALANRGPYRIVRHPMYLGYSALWVAWAAVTNAGIGPWLWAALGILLFAYRAFVEEKKMRAFVPRYTEYCQKVPGFLPLLRLRRKS